MTHFAILRHGDYQQKPNTPSAFQPYPLTELGRQQALEAGIKIAKYAHEQSLTIDEIHSSTLLRAWQTAEQVKTGLGDTGLSTQYFGSDALAERSVGSLANLTLDEIAAAIDADPRTGPLPENWKSDSDFRLPVIGAESLMMAGQRVSSYLKTLAEKSLVHQLNVIVVHGASFRHAAFLLGVLNKDQIHALSMHHCEPLFFKASHPSESKPWQHISGQWKIRNKTNDNTGKID